MGQVFLARDLAFADRFVALKLLLPDFLDATSEFMREYVLQRGLHHPAIPRVHDFGFGDHAMGEVPYFVMDYVRGTPMARAMYRIAKLEQAWPWMIQVLRALDHLHRHGYLHRDLKPSNILVRQDAPTDSSAHLIDYGIAIPLDAEPEELFIGTPEYSSPELMAGDPFDVRQDLYAFGLLLYEVVMGRRPWPYEDPTKLWEVRTYDTYPAIDRPDCPPRLVGLIDELLQPDIERRPASAAEVIERFGDATGFRAPIETVRCFQQRLEAQSFTQREGFQRAARDWHAGLRLEVADSDQRPGVLIIDSAPGFEGQRLLHELADRGAVGGARVVRLRLDQRTYEPLAAIEPALKVFRRLREASGGLPPQMLQGLAGAATMLTRLHGATILLIEGLQRADVMTLELLRIVFTGAANPKLRIIASVDPEETAASERVFDLLMAERFTHRVELEPLSLDAIGAWTDRVIGPGVLDHDALRELHFRSGGRPLRLLALLADDFARGRLVRSPSGYHVETEVKAPAPESSSQRWSLEDMVNAMRHQYPQSVVKTYLGAYADQIPHLIADGTILQQDNGWLSVGRVLQARRAYQRMPAADRTELHRRLAMVAADSPAFDGQYALVAREYLSADEPVLAIPALVGAANEAADRMDGYTARIHLERARNLLIAFSGTDDGRQTWRFRSLILRSSLRLARLGGHMQRWRSGATELVTLGTERGHLPSIKAGLEAKLDYHAAVGEWVELVNEARQRVVLDAQDGRLEGLALLRWAEARKLIAEGLVKDGLQRLDEVLRDLGPALAPAVHLKLLALRAETLVECQWLRDAHRALNEYEQRADQLRHEIDRVRARLLRARYWRESGNAEEGLKLLRQLTSEMTERYMRGINGMLELEFARCHAEFGWITTAVDHAERARALAERDNDTWCSLSAQGFIAWCVAASGQPAIGLEMAQDVIEDVAITAPASLHYELSAIETEVMLLATKGSGLHNVVRQASRVAEEALEIGLRATAIRMWSAAGRAALTLGACDGAVRTLERAVAHSSRWDGVGIANHQLLFQLARARHTAEAYDAATRILELAQQGLHQRTSRIGDPMHRDAWTRIPIHALIARGELDAPGPLPDPKRERPTNERPRPKRADDD